MTLVLNNLYIDKPDDIVNKLNNTYHNTIEMKPVDVKSNRNIECSKEINNKNQEFTIGDNVRISIYKKIFAKVYTPNWSEEVFLTKKFKSTIWWTHVIVDLNREEIVGMFCKRELQKTNKKKLRVGKG